MDPLFYNMLSIDSTSGKEREFALMLRSTLDCPDVRTFEVGDGTLNLLLCWGEPRVVFCTHMDTVPPYIPPQQKDGLICGRGACDAKGQIFSMYSACKALAAEGHQGFALLLLSGEETGSWGAKAFAKTPFSADYLIVGEPTDNHMVSASKGTKSFGLKFHGEAFHSGYPQFGLSAVDLLLDFASDLRSQTLPSDPLLGETTWNIGKLFSDNPQNILSPAAECLLYFRTTFESDALIEPRVKEIAARVENSRPGAGIEVECRGGDSPLHYFTLPGFPSKSVSFGSDAPHLTNFRKRSICGPGSITVAHRDNESITEKELLEAERMYIDMFKNL